MHLVPTGEEVIDLMRQAGALRQGHFEYANGLHAGEYLQIPLAMRCYQQAKVLSVGLSRLLRANSEIRAMISELSIVTPSAAGLPVAYGVCEALRARQVYWAEDDIPGELHFRQYIHPLEGEKAIIADDLLRTGIKLCRLKALLESGGAEVVGLAVVVYQPTPRTPDFGSLPLFYLAKLEATYYCDRRYCRLCRDGLPLQRVWG